MKPPVRLIVVLLLAAAGLVLIVIGVDTGWALIVPGCVALLVSLSAAYVIQAKRDAAVQAGRLRAAAINRRATRKSTPRGHRIY
jgi:hypothetical protein